jgi:hypothetical protein
MKFTLSILSALMIAMPVISTELLVPTTVTVWTDWKDTIFNVVDNNSSVIDKVLHPLDVLKFNNTAESASFSVERLVWKAKYIYRASSPPKLSAVHTDS